MITHLARKEFVNRKVVDNIFKRTSEVINNEHVDIVEKDAVDIDDKIAETDEIVAMACMEETAAGFVLLPAVEVQ